jgi:predicted nucleotidyltransferase
MSDLHEIKLPLNMQAVVDRFVIACLADGRILAAFLSGSYARGTADAHSDLDLNVITTDEDLQDFLAQRDAFVQKLGQAEFIENFDHPKLVFVILADGTEIEIGIARKSQFEEMHSGPYRVLVDKYNLLEGVVFRGREPSPAEQKEKLRRSIYWFWHDAGHFIKALHRGQLWWAQGQLEVLRGICVDLARLHNNFMDEEAGEDPYFKLDGTIPVDRLAVLRSTFCRLDRAELLKSGETIFRFYRDLALPLARAHDLPYPQRLERAMLRRLEEVANLP